MPKPRGRQHTSLTETAVLVVRVLRGHDGVKMIAPGEITSTRRAGSGKRFMTIVYTTAGLELIITGQSTQKVAVHTTGNTAAIVEQLTHDKRLRSFICKERRRQPGI